MRTIDTHNVRFGELAGPLMHGVRFFDFQLISTQVITEAFDHAFEDIVEMGGIPYAPVVATTTIYRYPGFRDTVTVETTPISVGRSSVELLYEMMDSDGNPLAKARIIHVTIAPEGGAQPLPEKTRERFCDAFENLDPNIGPYEANAEGSLPSFTESFDIRSPHIEGSNLAYFEEYPRFVNVALERFLESKERSLGTLSINRQSFRLSNWRWEFISPVQYESTLTIESDVQAITDDTLRIKHHFKSDGQTSIEGITEFSIFNESGEPISFPPAMCTLFTTE